jgi:hypothetical protein
MRWYLRVIEEPAGKWKCRRGLHAVDEHPDLETALEHIRDLTVTHGPAVVFVHYADGRVLRTDEDLAG